MLKRFRTYQSAVSLYRDCKQLSLPQYVRDQLLRASLSICLNLAEGSAKRSPKDRHRFFRIAFGSLREVQAILDTQDEAEELAQSADRLSAQLICLCRSFSG